MTFVTDAPQAEAELRMALDCIEMSKLTDNMDLIIEQMHGFKSPRGSEYGIRSRLGKPNKAFVEDMEHWFEIMMSGDPRPFLHSLQLWRVRLESMHH